MTPPEPPQFSFASFSEILQYSWVIIVGAFTWIWKISTRVAKLETKLGSEMTHNSEIFDRLENRLIKQDEKLDKIIERILDRKS